MDAGASGASVTTLLWIVAAGLGMLAIALVGSALLLFHERTLRRLLLPLVAFAAGTLLGGAFFHMIPTAVEQTPGSVWVFVWILAGFASFFAAEQVLHWHHCQREPSQDYTSSRKPLTYLILLGDGVHNFLGGLAVAGTMLIDLRLGLATWLAAAAHELPQELGDFGILLHGGWSKGQALLFNGLSSLTFLAAALLAYAASFQIDIGFLVPFAAGNFVYIAASDLVPEVNKHQSLGVNALHFASFLGGMLLLLALRLALG